MWYQNTYQICIFEYQRKVNPKNLTPPPLIPRADITSPNLLNKFQNLELFMAKVSKVARGAENIILTSKSFNAVIIEVQNRHLKSRPPVPGGTIFHFEKQFQHNTKSTLKPSLVMAAVVTIL
jgi:hypothetical protein